MREALFTSESVKLGHVRASVRARATDIHFTVPESSRGEATSNNLEETRKQGNTRFGKALYENTRFGKALYENTN